MLLISCLHDGGEGEALLEELQLVLYLRSRDPVITDLTEILLRPLGLLHSLLSYTQGLPVSLSGYPTASTQTYLFFSTHRMPDHREERQVLHKASRRPTLI